MKIKYKHKNSGSSWKLREAISIGVEFLIVSLMLANNCSVIPQATKNLMENLPIFWIEKTKREYLTLLEKPKRTTFDCPRIKVVPEEGEPEEGIEDFFFFFLTNPT